MTKIIEKSRVITAIDFRHNVILIFLLLGACCSFQPGVNRFRDFTHLSGTLEDCLAEVYDEISMAEWELRRREACLLDRIAAADLEPRVFTAENRRNRSRICEYIVQYPDVLLSIAGEDSSASLKRQAEQVCSRIIAVQKAHPAWFSPMVAGGAASALGMIPEALSAGKRRALLLRIMRANHPLLSRLCEELAAEMRDCRLWADRCFLRRFRLEVTDSWPEKASRRDGFARAGMKMLQRRRLVHDLVDEVGRGLQELVDAHAELMAGVKAGKGVWPAVIRISLSLERMKRCLEECRKCG